MKVDTELSPAQVAEAFCALGDEEQAQVFIECARIAADWKGSPYLQWALVGQHLRDCACANPAARGMVQVIADGMAPTPPPTKEETK